MRQLAALSLAALSLSLTPFVQAQPANDNIKKAFPLSAEERITRVTGNVRNSTLDTDVFTTSYVDNGVTKWLYPSLPLVWYKWTAPVTGTVTTQLMGEGFFVHGMTVTENPAYPYFSIAGQDSLSISYNNSGTSNANYGFAVVGGQTYYVGVARSTTLNASMSQNFIFIYLFTPGAISDSFDGRVPIGGEKFAFNTANTSFGEETGEPVHSTRAVNAMGKTGWMTITRPKRTLVTLSAESKTFKPLLAAYTGDSVTALTKVTESYAGTNSEKFNTATITFIAEAGVSYAIAADGDAGAGGFVMRGQMNTVKPGFVVKPLGVTVYQSTSASFTATASYTGETVGYQWERKAAGTKTWVPISDSDINYAGAKTDTLTISATTLEMNLDQFRVLATDDVGTSASPAAVLTVTEFPVFETEVLGTVDFDNLFHSTIPEPSNNGVYFAKGLPKGLSINPETGEITGVISGTARPGTYRVTYGSTNGKKANSLQYVLLIEVSPFSPALVATFEGLILSPTLQSLPAGKLTVTATKTGAFTGNYFSLAEGKRYPFRGVLLLDQNTRTAAPSVDLPVTIKRGKNLNPLQISLRLIEPPLGMEDVSATLGAEVWEVEGGFVGDTYQGRPIPKFTAAAPALWAGSYTAIMPIEANLSGLPDAQLPRGTPFATTKIAANTGKLAIRGRLPEGTAFTASLSSSSDARYLAAQKVHAGIGGSVAGEIVLSPRYDQLETYGCPDYGDSRIIWVKPADKDYADGVGPLRYRFLMEPWFNTLDYLATFNLSATGESAALIEHELFNNGSNNPYVLPYELAFARNGAIRVVDANSANLKLKVNAANGTFSGSFKVTDIVDTPRPGATKSRTVNISGVMIQKADIFTDTTIAAGFFTLPPLAPAKNKTSGLFEIRAGPPGSPFGGNISEDTGSGTTPATP